MTHLWDETCKPKTMRILISGAGIAGPTLAYWLAHYGFEVTLVERAPRLRTGGYIIDFWGAGFEIADRMGLLPELQRQGYAVQEVRVVNREGKRVAGFPVSAFVRIAKGRYMSLPRGELAASIFRRTEGAAETIFGDSVAGIEQTEGAVQVVFESGAKREFDLVVGADGLHSRVRELMFGPESRFEKYLGYQVAAFAAEGYRPWDELVYVMYTQVGQQVARFAMRGDRTMFLFSFADDRPDAAAAGDVRAQKALLRKRFSQSGWECPRILDALDTAGDLYFDRVSQIQMGSEAELWTRGRVVLVGDAAFCVSLLAGQGSALAMAAAYILAGELYRAGGDWRKGLARYQELVAPFVEEKQKAALRFAGLIAPKTKVALFLRNQVMNLLRIPWVADRSFASDFTDRLALPDY